MLRLILRFTVIELFRLQKGERKIRKPEQLPYQNKFTDMFGECLSDALEIIFTTVVYPGFYFVFKVLAVVV